MVASYFFKLTPLIWFIEPAALLLCLAYSFKRPSPPKPKIDGIIPITDLRLVPRRSLILILLTLLGASSLLTGLNLVVFSVIHGAWRMRGLKAVVAYSVGGVFAWLGSGVRAEWSNCYRRGGWMKALGWVGLGGEGLIASAYVRNLLGHRPSKHYFLSPEFYDLVFVLLRLIILPILLIALYNPIKTYVSVSPSSSFSERTPLNPSSSSNADPDQQHSAAAAAFLDPESQARLLAGPDAKNPSTSTTNANLTPNSYGTFPTPSGATTPKPAPSTTSKTTPETSPKGPADDSAQTWGQFFGRLLQLSPYLWPKTSAKLQVASVACIGVIALGRVANIYTPLSLGHVIDDLTNMTRPWFWFSIYMFLKLAQGSGGFLSVTQSMLWAPVMQYSDRRMSTLAFDHLLNLSLAWHTKKKTGEVLRILDRGSSLNNLFQLILFNILPIFFDVGAALFIFFFRFGPLLAVSIFVVMAAYVGVSIIMTGWRTKIRRAMNERDQLTRGIHADVLMNWETVKFFSAESHESSRYQSAIAEYQVLEYKVIGSLNLLNLTQNVIISLGLLVGSLIVADRVVKGKASPSEFVVFLTYLAQLYQPLNNLGGIYRQLSQTMVDSEKLLKLLNEELDIKDDPDAKDLVVTDGEIVFEDVHFAYDARQEALKGISFTIPKGASVALVGESGSGKSTILRLLYRFYEVTSGRILIDGQDISTVTQASLRKVIGVVPQDSVLFNESVRYNIGYGRIGSTDEEIEEAAKAAQLHSKVVGFPDGYDTRVGERGVRLSGGEKQRVSLARTMLKSPPILLLDEATSALDTTTEREIQQSLEALMKNRSSLSIAHRLSTIVNSSIIIVLSEGRILEAGSHAELVAKDGVFAEMWKKQITSEAEQLVLAGVVDGEAKGDGEAQPDGKVDAEPNGKSVAAQETADGKSGTVGESEGKGTQGKKGGKGKGKGKKK